MEHRLFAYAPTQAHIPPTHPDQDWFYAGDWGAHISIGCRPGLTNPSLTLHGNGFSGKVTLPPDALREFAAAMLAAADYFEGHAGPVTAGAAA